MFICLSSTCKYNFDSNEPVFTEEDLALQCQDEYVTGSYSPRLLRIEELEIDAIVYDPVDDMKKLELAREQVRTTGRVRVCHYHLQYLITY